MISGLKISVLSIWMRGWGLQGLSHQGHSVGLLDKNFHPENTFLPFCKRMGTDRLLPKICDVLRGRSYPSVFRYIGVELGWCLLLRIKSSNCPTWVGSQQHFSGWATNPPAAMSCLTPLDAALAVSKDVSAPAPLSKWLKYGYPVLSNVWLRPSICIFVKNIGGGS